MHNSRVKKWRWPLNRKLKPPFTLQNMDEKVTIPDSARKQNSCSDTSGWEVARRARRPNRSSSLKLNLLVCHMSNFKWIGLATDLVTKEDYPPLQKYCSVTYKESRPTYVGHSSSITVLTRSSDTLHCTPNPTT